LFDLGIGGSYWFTNNIGVFLDINNILNNKRARWANYPTIGTNFLGGVTVKF
jgi:outer membrane receptor protein involved in Fe transport